MGGHVFLEYVSFMMTCIMETFVLREIMLCSFVGGHVLWEDMSSSSACLQNGIFFKMMCLTGMHVLQIDMSHLRICLVGGHV